MSARLPRSRTVVARYGAWLLVLLASCGLRPIDEAVDGGGGPCGRGKARSCTCDDGSKGIAHCVAGSDWGECYCDPSSLEVEADGGSAVGGDARPPREPSSRDDELDECDSTFDFRAHAPGDFSEPYLVAPPGLLPGSSSQRVCFYFRVPYVGDSVALAFFGLLYETPGLRSWLLYGLDETDHADGEVAPCNGAEPGAYLLAGFAPGVQDVRLPDDVGLALPQGPRAGMVLEVQYQNDSPAELLDRTGVRVCAARTRERPHTAAVHITGSASICVPPGASGHEVRGDCAPRTDRGPIHLLDVWPSMHQHGQRMQITIARQDGGREVLHDAPFDFDHQQRFPVRDVVLMPGDRLETRCFYENDSLLPIPFGPSADEETCFGFVTAWPAGALSSDALGGLGSALGIAEDRSCLDPIGVLGSCNGPVDAL